MEVAGTAAVFLASRPQSRWQSRTGSVPCGLPRTAITQLWRFKNRQSGCCLPLPKLMRCRASPRSRWYHLRVGRAVPIETAAVAWGGTCSSLMLTQHGPDRRHPQALGQRGVRLPTSSGLTGTSMCRKFCPLVGTDVMGFRAVVVAVVVAVAVVLRCGREFCRSLRARLWCSER
jgi:hypothetical protein